MLKQVLLVLSFCALAIVRGQNPCLGAPAYLPFSFVAAPESCNAYIICMDGDTIRGERCPDGMYFEPVNQVCGQSSCLDCSPFGVQNLPHPDDCVQFIECVMGHRTVRYCPNDLLFDREAGHCNLPHTVQCPHDPVIPPPDGQPPITDPPITYPPITDPPITYPPITDPPITQPPITDPPVTQPPLLPVCVPGQLFHAHPSDCTQFFFCNNLILVPFTCPNELHWNQFVNACDRPEYAGCVHGPQPPGGGQPPGTTQPPAGPDPPLFPPGPTDPPQNTPWPTFNPIEGQDQDQPKSPFLTDILTKLVFNGEQAEIVGDEQSYGDAVPLTDY